MEDKNFKHMFARIISTLFVPPSFTIIVFYFFAFAIEKSIPASLKVFLTALFFGFILPIVLFVYLRKHGKIIDEDATKKEERTLPFLIAVLFYVAGFAALIFFNANLISIAFWFCYITNTLFTVIINRHWKISAHSMGAAGPIAAVSFVNINFAFVLVIILLLVGWSRIELKCHTLLQVLAGAALGFTSSYVQIYIILELFNNAR